MPGVQIVEAMAQVASFAMYPSFLKNLDAYREGFQCFLVAVDGARFRSPVTPGDSLRIETEVTLCRSSMWGFKCKAMVDGKVVAEADLLDAGVIFGTGYAPFRGGPLQYARERGVDHCVTALRALEQRHGSRFSPAAGWDTLRG
jgi:3-hydroxyacyl-CoA dehydrogenase/enoyl-CoA hydratase/3-hydroxybutyryl-CoA epimerase